MMSNDPQNNPRTKVINEIEQLSYKQARLEYRIKGNKENSAGLVDERDNVIQQIILELFTAKNLKMNSEEYIGRNTLTTKEYFNSMINIYKKYDIKNILY